MEDSDSSPFVRLAVPDALMPVQYYEGRRTQDPQVSAMKRLMLAVLQDALRCLQAYRESHIPANARAFHEAEVWMMDRKAQGPFAFETICEALGIEPDYLRDGVRRWRSQSFDEPTASRLQGRSSDIGARGCLSEAD